MNHLASKHASGPWSRTVGLLQAERGDLGVAVVYSIAIGALTLVLPVTIQGLVNTVAFGSVLQPIAVLTTLVSAALLGAAVLTALRFAVLERVQRRIFVRNASDVLDSLLRFRMDALEGPQAPELVNRFLDVATVQKSASVLVVDGLTVLMQTLTGVILLGAYHPYLLVFDVVLVASIAFIVFGLGRGAVETSIRESRAKYGVVAWLQEVGRHSAGLRTPAGSNLATQRANQLVLDYLDQRAGHFRILLRQIIGTQALQAVAISSLLGVGGYLVIAGELTLGQLVAAELVVTAAVGSFAKFGKSLETFYDLQAALDKLEHLTGLPLERSGGEAAGTGSAPAVVRVAKLAFGYDGQRAVLHDVDLAVAAGEKVAVHGTGAAGKSTLLDLLYGLREPQRGTIELDGIDYRHWRLEEIRRNVLLLRGTEIFPGTVYENVAMGSGADAAAVRAALAQADILDAVNALPLGLQTELSASGRPLSPSQAMRLGFARAFLMRPRLLLVDEALDSVDDLRLDGGVVRTLFGAEAPWTLIVVTERQDLWPLCGQVHGLGDGQLRTQDGARQ